MQVKEEIILNQIKCQNCNKYYTPSKQNPLTKCSYCQKPFTDKPIQVKQTKTVTKEKCLNCNHTYKPRTIKDKPVCPKCHKAT